MNERINIAEAELLGLMGVSTTKNEKDLCTFKWAAEIIRTPMHATHHHALIKRCKNDSDFRGLVEKVGIIEAMRMYKTGDRLKEMPE